MPLCLFSPHAVEAHHLQPATLKKDAKAVFEYMTSEVENCKTLEEFNDIEKKIEPIQKEFEDYEKDHPEYKEQFQKASQNEALKFIGAVMKKEQELKKK